MKTSSIELFFRNEFNIPNETDINIHLISDIDGVFEFKVSWIQGNIYKQSIFTIPRIEIDE